MSLATRLAPPGVVTVHQEHRPSQLRGGTGQPLFQMSPRLDALVVLTDRTKDWFVDTFGTSAPRLEVIPNSIPDGFRPRSDLRNPVVAIAGRMVPEKRIDHAIRAFGKVAAAHPQWTLRVYGDGPLLPEMRRLAADLGLHDNVQLVGATDRMTEEWAKASLALLSSRDGERCRWSCWRRSPQASRRSATTSRPGQPRSSPTVWTACWSRPATKTTSRRR